MQRPFKHSIKQSYHEFIVQDMLEWIEKNEPVLAVDKRIKTVRDQSVTWLWNAYNAVNSQALVKKVRDNELPGIPAVDLQSQSLSKCVVYVGGIYPMKVSHPLMLERN
ncbi:hypothetical protein BYT27DRAFT_7097258 [Phlegmacium glaucopus]|nr:hypothetical protein BYT27DRAFT_7097258 [Phlegmacium glaucopus]